MILKQWAEKTVIDMTNQIKSLIDCGLEMETAVDIAFENSVLAMPYKMRVLENVAHYRHEHCFVTDVVTGREWCKTCQQFKYPVVEGEGAGQYTFDVKPNQQLAMF